MAQAGGGLHIKDIESNGISAFTHKIAVTVKKQRSSGSIPRCHTSLSWYCHQSYLLVGGDALPLSVVVILAGEAVRARVVAGVQRVHVVPYLGVACIARSTICTQQRIRISNARSQ